MVFPHVGLSLLLSILVLHNTGADAGGGRRPEKLFVFGDSYADTGNVAKLISPSWHEPYGITFPGHPAGRFSDGRVLTDYVASFLGIKSPIPYSERKAGGKLLAYGMNFAVGGSGVFDTMFFQANLTVQIDRFGEEIAQGVFSEINLRSSLAFVSVSGNDYSSYMATGGTMEGLKEFTPKLIDALKPDLQRLHDIGVTKVAVTNLHPIGCTPSVTAPVSHSRCNATANRAVRFHNRLLRDAVRDLNKNANGSSPFVVFGLHRAFQRVIKHETKKFPEILEPCCAGLTVKNSCGDEDFNGTKLYTVCSRRDAYFYWDNVHLTQAAWSAVFAVLGRSLKHLFI